MKSRFIFGCFLSFLLLISISQIVFADQFPGYQPLTSIPGVENQSVDTSGAGLSNYLNSLYKLGVAAAAGLAVIMVIWGGVEYITAVAGEGKSGGKERITSAILGLLLALGSYIILNTINPDLLSLKFTLPDAQVGK
jgi:amino acid transporter